MKYYESRFSRFLSGRGFYLVLALCLIAIGAAAWSAYAGLMPSDEPVAEAEDVPFTLSTPSLTLPEQTTSAAEAQADASEVYDASEESVPDEPEAPPVATSFILPVTGDIAKSFSETELKYSNTFKDMRLHLGTDILTDAGTVVKAAGNGIVVAVINDALLGVYVEIDHGNGVVGRYCGLDEKVSVKEDDPVVAGTKLGTLATVPGESMDQAHLHLEFYKDDQAVDPLEILGVTQ